ncbi:nucleolysin TIAR-like isoform X2 [Varroa destructor]|uniref:RRM domain-containing protein n=1 Tax=Varroa destructor TaxID=109461 RepID=A0A7M7KCV1_VARDE|nr:nucleolysin TIAR-like isoform X2 [Varroa destructor]
MILSSSGEMFVNGAAAVMNPLGLHLGLPGAASTPHLSQAAALTAALRSSQPNGISALAIAPAPTEIVPLLQEMKGNWNNSPAGSTKQDTNKHFHIFVGDLSSDVETQQLREAFTPFGEISDCRVVRDPQTQKSKGYGFVSFLRKQDAETAINSMNGQWLGGRVIRTNWATRRPTSNANGGQEGSQGSNTPKYTPLTFDEVYNQASPTNCTVYCGGLGQGLSEELIQKTFSSYGIIQEIRVFKDKGYAFVRFATKESATHAIVAVHNTEVNGQIVKCSWGKESSDPNNQQVQQHFAFLFSDNRGRPNPVSSVPADELLVPAELRPARTIRSRHDSHCRAIPVWAVLRQWIRDGLTSGLACRPRWAKCPAWPATGQPLAGHHLPDAAVSDASINNSSILQEKTEPQSVTPNGLG